MNINKMIKEINSLECLILRNHYKILICDDEKDIRLMFKEILQENNFTFIHTSENAIEAVNLMSIYDYDLIITDYRMGGGDKDGDHIYKFIKNYYSMIDYPSLLVISADSKKIVDLGKLNKTKITTLTKSFNNSEFITIVLNKYYNYLRNFKQKLINRGEL